MNLIESTMTDCVLLDETTVSDGRGAFIVTWVEGARIKASITPDNQTAVRVAEAQGLAKQYKIITLKNAPLKNRQVLKRLDDGKIFRMTQDSIVPPDVSTTNNNCTMAEEWALPAGV